MLKPKTTKVTKEELIKMIQASNIKSFILLEPYDQQEEKTVLEQLRRNKAKTTSVIIGLST